MPIWTHGALPTQNETTALISVTTTPAPPSTPARAARVVTPTHSPAPATGMSVADLLETVMKGYEVKTGRTKNDKLKINEVFAERVEANLDRLMLEMITIAQNIQRPPSIFLQGIYTRIV